MKIIERLELAQAQTWWLPESVVIHEGPDHCFYHHGGRYTIVRFCPAAGDTVPLLNRIMDVVGGRPVHFAYFPHRHDDEVLGALKTAGFRPGHRHEARVIHVDAYDRSPPADITVIMVETFEEMKRVYAVRSEAFGAGAEESDGNLRLYWRAATGPKARVRQFMAVDAQSAEPLSQAGMSLFPDLQIAFLFAGATLEYARGRGAYTALVAARVAYARAIGIEYIGLFAREETSAPIVARQGFEHCGEMHYWCANQ